MLKNYWLCFDCKHWSIVRTINSSQVLLELFSICFWNSIKKIILHTKIKVNLYTGLSFTVGNNYISNAILVCWNIVLIKRKLHENIFFAWYLQDSLHQVSYIQLCNIHIQNIIYVEENLRLRGQSLFPSKSKMRDFIQRSTSETLS